jgi:hypothetical protein
MRSTRSRSANRTQSGRRRGKTAKPVGRAATAPRTHRSLYERNNMQGWRCARTWIARSKEQHGSEVRHQWKQNQEISIRLRRTTTWTRPSQTSSSEDQNCLLPGHFRTQPGPCVILTFTRERPGGDITVYCGFRRGETPPGDSKRW